MATTKKYDLRSAEYTPTIITAGAAKTGGAFETIEDVNGFWMADVANGAEGTFIYKAKMVRGTKATGVAIAVGDKIYHHTANDNLTNVSTDAVLIGHALEAKLSADTDLLVEWDGTIAGQEA